MHIWWIETYWLIHGWDNLSVLGVDVGNPSQNGITWTKICCCHHVLYNLVFPSCCAFQGWLEILIWLLLNLLEERSTCISHVQMLKPDLDWLATGWGEVSWPTELESSRFSLASDTAGAGHSNNVTRTWSVSIFCSAFFLCWLHALLDSPSAETRWLIGAPDWHIYSLAALAEKSVSLAQ